MNAQPSPRHLYAAGHFARTLAWSFVDLVLGYYLHARLGLSAAHTGQLLAISLAYSSLLDLLLAAVFTRLRNQQRLALRLPAVQPGQRNRARLPAIAGRIVAVPYLLCSLRRGPERVDVVAAP